MRLHLRTNGQNSMVVIRLARGGSKKNPFYDMVVTDKRNPRDGRFIERLGYFNPMARGNATRLHVEQERVAHWLSHGAQPSQRVKQLLKTAAKGTAAPVATKAQMRKTQSESAAKAAKKAAEAKPADESSTTEEA